MAEKQHLMSRTAGGLMLALTVALLALVLGPVSSALAGPPQLTIEFPEGSPTNNPTPQLRGHTDDTFDEVTVNIQRVGGGGPPLIRLSPVGEEWSVSPAQNLPDGEYTATATQTNAEEETGHSGSVTFTVDTSPPTVVLNQPTALSNNPKPSFSGTASDTKPVVVHIFRAGHPEVTATSGGGGAWSANNEATLESGNYSAVATQESSLGNPAGRSNEVAFTIKTQGPAVTLNAVPTPTNVANPTLTGAAGTAVGDNTSVTVKIFKGASPSGTVAQTLTAPVIGTGWSVPAAHLADGTYTAQAEQSDQAGNIGKSPTPSSFVVDTVAPSVSLVSGSKEKHTPSPVFEGSAGTAIGDLPAVTLKIYAGASVSGTPVRVASVVSKNAKWSVESLAPLATGTYTARAEQADEAGNHGLTAPSTFTISSNGPAVTLTPVAAETNNATPSFSGSAGLAGGEVRVLVYAGTHAEGPVARELTVTASGSTWSAGPPVPALADATYTAIAEECGAGHIAKCPPEQLGISQSEATFTVDTVSPTVTLSSPSNGSSAGGGSQLVEGTAGTAVGDASTISVRLASGSSIGGQTLQTRVVANEAGRWHVDFEGLTAGTYTTQAEQSDAAGNTGVSQASTFSLTPPAVGAAPTAAFTWVPSTPQVGQAVSLLSTSSDPASPISGYAWDLTGLGSFNPAGATNTTTFSSVGNHVVRLHVAAANGLSGVASETIAVIPATYPLMRPFPIVRLASIGTRSGIRLKLLRVQAPNGARISVTCRTRGCPAKSQHMVAIAAADRVVAYTFRKFERSLRAGVVLEVRVSGTNQIGKYTRYTIRKGRLPLRVDLCLSPEGAKPIACPSR